MDDMVERVIVSRRRLVVFQGIDRRGHRGWYVSLPMETEEEDREVLAGPFASSAEADHEADRINARAAIEAMRDPTKAMIAAGDASQWDDLMSEPVCMQAQVPWRAMIEAALSEELKRPDDKDAA